MTGGTPWLVSLPPHFGSEKRAGLRLLWRERMGPFPLGAFLGLGLSGVKGTRLQVLLGLRAQNQGFRDRVATDPRHHAALPVPSPRWSQRNAAAGSSGRVSTRSRQRSPPWRRPRRESSRTPWLVLLLPHLGSGKRRIGHLSDQTSVSKACGKAQRRVSSHPRLSGTSLITHFLSPS